VKLRAQIPNLLSIARIPLAGAFLLLYGTDSFGNFIVGLSIAVVALLTDIADGRLARRLGVGTDLGALLDGLGDKAFYVAIYLVIAQERPAELLLLWLLIIREICLYGLRIVDPHRGATTKSLRWISQAFAVLIRVYFGFVFFSGGSKVFGYSVPQFLRYDFLLAYAALAVGTIGLVAMVRKLGDELPS
jgi:phosphatidylglycerophosphate synthase